MTHYSFLCVLVFLYNTTYGMLKTPYQNGVEYVALKKQHYAQALENFKKPSKNFELDQKKLTLFQNIDTKLIALEHCLATLKDKKGLHHVPFCISSIAIPLIIGFFLNYAYQDSFSEATFLKNVLKIFSVIAMCGLVAKSYFYTYKLEPADEALIEKYL